MLNIVKLLIVHGIKQINETVIVQSLKWAARKLAGCITKNRHPDEQREAGELADEAVDHVAGIVRGFTTAHNGDIEDGFNQLSEQGAKVVNFAQRAAALHKRRTEIPAVRSELPRTNTVKNSIASIEQISLPSSQIRSKAASSQSREKVSKLVSNFESQSMGTNVRASYRK
jgi:hypothetical protein